MQLLHFHRKMCAFTCRRLIYLRKYCWQMIATQLFSSFEVSRTNSSGARFKVKRLVPQNIFKCRSVIVGLWNPVVMKVVKLFLQPETQKIVLLACAFVNICIKVCFPSKQYIDALRFATRPSTPLVWVLQSITLRCC